MIEEKAVNIEEKYNIVYFGKRRYYIEDLSIRDYSLENTTPYYFSIGFDEFVETAWVQMLAVVTNYLIEEYQPKNEELLNFNLSWSKAKLFSETNKGVNKVKLNCGLFLNVNHTALHSCWVLQEILNYFNVDISKCKLIIHRNPIAEPDEVKTYIKKRVKDAFKVYVKQELLKDEAYYLKIVNGLDKIDYLFKKHFKTFESIYLIDNPLVFSNYKSSFIGIINSIVTLDSKIKIGIKKRLDVYNRFVNRYYQ